MRGAQAHATLRGDCSNEENVDLAESFLGSFNEKAKIRHLL